MFRRTPSRAGLPLLLAALLLPGLPTRARALAPGEQGEQPSPAREGTLSDISQKRRVLLVVTRSKTVDSRDTAITAIEDARKGPPALRPRYARVYNALAGKLNEYIRKHGGMSAAAGADDAEIIVLFNLLEWRRSVSGYYPFGELYVVTNEEPPKVVWRARKVMWAEDAIKEMIRDLKASRGQR